ncbi:hypothetical protein NA78x_001640 [Anatilimnocola sp. NA78]|uniref:hypothetical protein n=1 Tax=Anatilimnocola sp. NA78 TaxID=3415683 RepID=UPI003CE4606A
MFGNLWLDVALIGVGLAAVVGLIAWKRLRRTEVKVDLNQARRKFQLRREWLEAHFLTIASQSGKPRGLQWAECDFDDGVAFARDRSTGRLRAFVGVTISFEAIEGGGMEDNPNVRNRRAATAVFNMNGDAWSTDGRAIFNLNPEQAIEHFGQELEHVE